MLLLLTLGLEFSGEEFSQALRRHAPSGVVDLVLNATPGAIAGWLLGFSPAGVVAMAGVFHVVVKGQWATLSQVVWVLGDGLVVIAMVAWAAYALLLKKWASPLSSTARLAATCLGGSLVLLPFAIIEWTATQHAGWSLNAGLLVLAAAVFPGVGAYWAYGFCQKTLGASRVATSLYLGPLYGGLAAWLFLGETLGWHHAVGAAFILPGIYLASQKVNSDSQEPA